MKTKMKIMLVLISVCITFGTFANKTHLYVTSNMTSPSYNYYCASIYDTIILHKPIGETGARWTKPDGNDVWADSAIVIIANQGEWSFNGDNISKTLCIYFSTGLPIAPLASDTTICGLGAFTMTLNGLNDPVRCTYTWPGTTITTQTRTVTTPGIYWLNVSNACGMVTDSIHVYQKSNTLPNLGPDTNLCNGNTINLSVGTGYNYYQWSSNTTTTNQNIAITAPGMYWVEVANVCIGTKRDTVMVGSFTTPTPNLGADRNICQGSTIVLNPGVYDRYLWYNGQTTATVTVGAGTYWMEAWNGSCRALSNTLHLTQVVPTPEPICFVEFDTITWKNNIHWTSNLPANTDSVRIYKEDGATFVAMQTISATQNHFIDMNSAPQAQSYSYKLSTIDSCGNESTLSSLHKTITLAANYNTITHTYNFIWSSYEGIPVSYYYLFGIDANNNVTQITIVNGSVNMYIYENPNAVYVKYYVGFEAPNCDGTKTTIMVKSNWIEKDPLINGIQEMGEIPFSVYPNPVKDQIQLNLNLKSFRVDICNIVGQVLLSQNDTKNIDISSLAAGSYFISITADGIKTNKKFIKQ